MSTAQAPAPASAPTITNAGTAPATRRKLFVNLPVADLQRSIRFWEALGFRFNPQFTDGTATCMLVGEDAYCMFLTRERFASFTARTQPDPATTAGVLLSLSAESRAAVDAMVAAAVAAGGAPEGVPEDHGFMYERSFTDPDGHGWGVFWMAEGPPPAT